MQKQYEKIAILILTTFVIQWDVTRPPSTVTSRSRCHGRHSAYLSVITWILSRDFSYKLKYTMKRMIFSTTVCLQFQKFQKHLKMFPGYWEKTCMQRRGQLTFKPKAMHLVLKVSWHVVFRPLIATMGMCFEAANGSRSFVIICGSTSFSITIAIKRLCSIATETQLAPKATSSLQLKFQNPIIEYIKDVIHKYYAIFMGITNLNS